MHKLPCSRPLLRRWPQVAHAISWVPIGQLPTPVEPLQGRGAELPAAAAVWVKRDDLTAPEYGGNKVRTLEVLFGLARKQEARCVVATGAFGSNHATATAVHARGAGFEAGAVLYPQPRSQAAVDNLRVTADRVQFARALPHWSCLPVAMTWLRAAQPGAYLMTPGGAIAEGTLGYVSAALELAEQVGAKQLPPPREIVLPVGSGCSTAGLLLGLRVAWRLGMWPQGPPRLVAVRVTPWPVTSRVRLVGLARAASERLSAITGDDRLRIGARELSVSLELDGRYQAPGYGWPNAAAGAAAQQLAGCGVAGGTLAACLDATYGARAVAGLVARLRLDPAIPRLLWLTKSRTVPVLGSALPTAGLPRAWRRYLSPGQGEGAGGA